jgi:hypothetical protein
MSLFRFPMQLLRHFIHVALPAALWLGGSPGGKEGRCAGLTTLPPSCADCLQILWTLNSWSPKGLSRPVQGLIYIWYERVRRADSARQPSESLDRMCACAASLCSSLWRQTSQLPTAVLCVVVWHRLETNGLIENLASCEILAVIRFFWLQPKILLQPKFIGRFVVFEGQVSGSCDSELGSSKAAEQNCTMKMAAAARPPARTPARRQWRPCWRIQQQNSWKSAVHNFRFIHKFHYITVCSCGREAALP